MTAPRPRRVRAYALTGGRTRSGADYPLEALVVATGSADTPGLSPEHRQILQRCADPASVVELAAALDVPVGVARVLIGDLVTDAHVRVHRTDTDALPVHRDLALLEEVLDGIESL